MVVLDPVSVEQKITSKIRQHLHPVYLQVINESHKHNVPPGSESHFKVIVVTSAFDRLSLIQRHQKINEILQEELQASIHALSLGTYTPAEWQQRGGLITDSPPCLGGSKKVEIPGQ